MKIGVWGASITYGEGDEAAHGWVGRLRKSLFKQGIQVYNRGICGNTSTDLLKRFGIELVSLKPDIILLSIGMNDSKYPKGAYENCVPLDMYEENIRKLITSSKAFTDKVVLVGLTNVTGPLVTPAGSKFDNDLIRPYNEVLMKCSQQEKVSFIDLFGMLNSDLDFSPDELHPNAAGYEKIYERVAGFLASENVCQVS